MSNNPYAASLVDSNSTEARTHASMPGGMKPEKLDAMIILNKYAVTSFAVAVGLLIVKEFLGVPMASTLLLLPIMMAGFVAWLTTACLAFRMHGIFFGSLLTMSLFLPLINLFTFAAVLNDASKQIKACGYKVGFLGEIKPSSAAGMAGT